MATEQQSKTTARSVTLRPLPLGAIPSPRREDPSESIPVDSPSQHNLIKHIDPKRDHSKRNLIVAGIAVVAVVAAGAGLAVLLGHSAPGIGARASAAPEQRSSADIGYLVTVHQQAAFATTGDDSLIRTGHLLCDRLRSGASPDEIALASVGKAYTAEDVSTALGAAAGAYCPDQMARVGPTG